MCLVCAAFFPSNQLRAKTEPAMAKLTSDLGAMGCGVATKPSRVISGLRYTPGDSDKRCIKMLSMVKLELSELSPAYRHRLGIKRVVLVKGLFQNGVRLGATPDTESESLIVDCGLANTFHVVRAHYVDNALFSYFLRRFKGGEAWKNAAWESAARFNYAQPYVPGRLDGALNHPSPGFVDSLAKSSETRDMAEIYCMLFDWGWQEVLKNYMSEDRTLKKKYEVLLAILRPYGFQVPKVKKRADAETDP
jgi:hypothetical protein